MDLTRLDYWAIVERYNLTPIKQGTDLALTTPEGLTLTKDFEMKRGDDVQSALGRVVGRWWFNAPTLNTLLNAIIDAKQRLADAEKAREEFVTLHRPDPVAAMKLWREIGYKIEAHRAGSGGCAGAIMVVLQNSLRREWSDLNKPAAWDMAGALIGGQAFGPIVEAAANNFRHSDEWSYNLVPTDQQLISIRVLAAVLGQTLSPDGANHQFRGNRCPEILMALCDDSFEALMNRFFGFARELAGL